MESPRFITVFTKACHLFVSWARLIHSMPNHPVSFRSIPVLYFHLRIYLPSDWINGTVNQEDKIIRNNLFDNTKLVIWSFHRVIDGKAGRPGCYAYWLDNFFRSFEETYCLHPQCYEPIHGLITLRMKAVRSFEASGHNDANTRRNNPEDCFLNKETSLKVITYFRAVSFPVGKAATLPLH